jgi:hypothetical protein
MSRISERRAYLNPDTIWQLKTLFGTGTNAHARLALHEIVPRHELQKALSGWPIKHEHERLIVARWLEWRHTFLVDPQTADMTSERIARTAGDYFHPEARDLVTEKLSPDASRFTLLPDARKHL